MLWGYCLVGGSRAVVKINGNMSSIKYQDIPV